MLVVSVTWFSPAVYRKFRLSKSEIFQLSIEQNITTINIRKQISNKKF